MEKEIRLKDLQNVENCEKSSNRGINKVESKENLAHTRKGYFAPQDDMFFESNSKGIHKQLNVNHLLTYLPTYFTIRTSHLSPFTNLRNGLFTLHSSPFTK